MREIKINFTDYGTSFVPEENIFYRLLSQDYKVTIAPKPDYLFYSSGGYRHLQYDDAIRIFNTGENLAPDFNICDYAIAFHHIQLEDRYLRFPFFLTYNGCWEQLDALQTKIITPDLAQRKFCNFVYSNGQQADPLREYFFHRLCQYKKVDSAGRYLNNMGGKTVKDKLDFIGQYKFTIAFENSAVSGYTTEKIVDPMRVNSMPIYYGDPNVGVDFNSESFIQLKSKEEVDAIINEIIRLDRDNEAYLEKLSRPWLNAPLRKPYEERLQAFLRHIVEQPKEKAFRTTRYGWTGYYKRDLKRVTPLIRNFAFQKIWGAIDRCGNIKKRTK